MTFAGFSRAGLSFLAELGNREKSWLDANRATYQAEVAEPAKAFAEAMGESLAMAISPDIVAVPKTNGSISPINNDVRFSKDASPYKDHLLFRFWEGSDKKSSPTLFVRVSEESVGFASGAHIGSIDRWRQLIADDETGSGLVTAIGVSESDVSLRWLARRSNGFRSRTQRIIRDLTFSGIRPSRHDGPSRPRPRSTHRRLLPGAPNDLKPPPRSTVGSSIIDPRICGARPIPGY